MQTFKILGAMVFARCFYSTLGQSLTVTVSPGEYLDALAVVPFVHSGRSLKGRAGGRSWPFVLCSRKKWVTQVTVFGTMLEDHYKMNHSDLEEVMLPISRTCSIIIVSAYVAFDSQMPEKGGYGVLPEFMCQSGRYIVFQLFTHRTVPAPNVVALEVSDPC